MTEALKPSEVLSRAADLIEPEGAWTQSMRARSAGNSWVDPSDRAAVCWCLVGSIQRVAGRCGDNAYGAPELEWVSKAIKRAEPAMWNDAPNRRQSAVVAALRRAADLAREAGQ